MNLRSNLVGFDGCLIANSRNDFVRVLQESGWTGWRNAIIY